MTSISLGNYVSSFLIAIVMKISTKGDILGWIPGNLNLGHLDRFYFLLAALTTANLVVYVALAKWYKYINFEGNNEEYNLFVNLHHNLMIFLFDIFFIVSFKIDILIPLSQCNINHKINCC